MRSVDTEISPAPGPGTARGISENHSPSVTREQSGTGAGPDNCGKSESQYKVSRFGTLEHKLCKSLNKQRFYYCFISGLEVLKKLEQHLSQGCKCVNSLDISEIGFNVLQMRTWTIIVNNLRPNIFQQIRANISRG